ncbi:hypothetical protein SPBR_01519 [Sporothrix brasiliensis 5110]|uniref:Uncharacterized protein n=1 Tax=Sporothrix brasiliensis 5110 TaxID=1398154 RepID=A0A0C2FIU5_9PEZI|nr:uncharacterized protein SPBR_01519 [Sporothrix brasiliensis 5110]KIH91058.1 hypothetical protein SPBR_01519 [Sporothrix brasiliensis 5110]
MAPPAPPMSRLDTLPLELLREVFDYAFAGGDDDLEFDVNDCYPIDRDYANLVKLAQDEESSPTVRAMAVEQQHRIISLMLSQTPKTAVDALTNMTNHLQNSWQHGGSVRLLHLRRNPLPDAIDEMSDELLGAFDEMTDELPGALEEIFGELPDAFDAMIDELPDAFDEMSDGNEGSEGGDDNNDASSSSASTSDGDIVAAGILGLLHTTPGLTRLVATIPGLGQALAASADAGSPLFLGRLRRLELYEPHTDPAAANTAVLDTNGALLRGCPGLSMLRLQGFCDVVSSTLAPASSSQAARMQSLRWLDLVGCYIPAAGLHKILDLIGPQMSSLTVELLRWTCRPSRDEDDAQRRRMFTTYDLLDALVSRGATTSLRTLDLQRKNFPAVQFMAPAAVAAMAAGHVDPHEVHEDASAINRLGPSVMDLLPAFSALTHLVVSIDVLDWRTVDVGIVDFAATRAVAGALVAQLPPNLIALTVMPALREDDFMLDVLLFEHENSDNDDMSLVCPGWWPRRQALMQALMAATRGNGGGDGGGSNNNNTPHLPQLASISIPHAYDTIENEMVAYPAAATAPNDSDPAPTPHTVNMFGRFATQVLALDPADQTTVLRWKSGIVLHSYVL